MTNGSESPSDWNGNSIPPRPPLPDAVAPDPLADEPPKFKIGMPPGMDVHLDTIPSSDLSTPIPVAKPAFGPAPTPLGGVPTPAAAPPAPPQRPVAPAIPPATATRTVSTATPPAPTGNPRLVLPDGAVLPLLGGLIVGRDPQPQSGYGVSALAALHDVERSVSKTHAILNVSDGRIWITDLNSTNGTFAIAPDGELTPCPPEVATLLDAGADIRFGEYRVRVALD